MTEEIATGDARIDLKFADAVATLTINRPEKLNALDFAMITALEQAAALIDNHSGLRVAILTGKGEKSFCAGGDIEAWSALPADEFAMRWVRHGHRAFDALARMRCPLIAVLNGHCLGGGLELAATADFRIAEAHVKVGLPETGIGIIPGWSGTQRAVRRFGPVAIKRMSLFGEVWNTQEACGMGVVDVVVGKGKGLAAAMDMATSLCGRSPKATLLAKLMINVAEGEEQAAAIEALAAHTAAASEDLREGIAAFRGKRKPAF